MDTEYIEEWTESLSDSMNDSVNDSHKANEEVVLVKEDLEAFRDTYPKHAALGILEAPYKAALRDGATPEQLLTSATNYAAECKRTNQEKRYIKFPTKFLKEEMWHDYLTDNHKTTRDEALSWDVTKDPDPLGLRVAANNPNAPF
ncbi:MAG: hypothetical protein ACTH98_06970 [Corynebacterium flavescens]|uniref:hypothetical protein n=1 Tax=Corynebacterium flavescens TaxID=28028 RepID=UPI003F8F65E6